nr:hypothetical protein BaRGS_029599 [Batillaria attramentaria]
MFKELGGLLEEHHQYTITLEVMNDAGLLTRASVNFTVFTRPPDMSGLSLSLDGASVVDVVGEKVAISDSTDTLALNLQIDSSVERNLDYIEWSVGAIDSTEGDIFPKTRVATSNSSHVAIVGGYMHFDGVPSNMSVGDFTQRNYTDPAGVSKGAMTVGVLSEADLDAQYGSAASTQYSPFIVRPDPVTDHTSRLLRNSGDSVYMARLSDSGNAFSMQLTLNTHVMCYLGYEGQWCQTDTNECKRATCSPIHDCVDLIGRYRCDLNPTKAAAIVVCSVVAAILLVVGVYKLKKKPSKVSAMEAPIDEKSDGLKQGHDCPEVLFLR